MGRIALLFVLMLGVVGGVVAVEMGVLDSSTPGDSACNAALDGDGWTANLNESTNVSDGTRLVCEHANGTRTDVTVNVSIDVGPERG